MQISSRVANDEAGLQPATSNWGAMIPGRGPGAADVKGRFSYQPGKTPLCMNLDPVAGDQRRLLKVDEDPLSLEAVMNS